MWLFLGKPLKPLLDSSINNLLLASRKSELPFIGKKKKQIAPADQVMSDANMHMLADSTFCRAYIVQQSYKSDPKFVLSKKRSKI